MWHLLQTPSNSASAQLLNPCLDHSNCLRNHMWQQAGSKKGSRDCASGRRTKTQEPALLTQSGALAARCRSRLRLHPPSLRGTASRGVGAWEVRSVGGSAGAGVGGIQQKAVDECSALPGTYPTAAAPILDRALQPLGSLTRFKLSG